MNLFKVLQRISNRAGTRSRVHGCVTTDKLLFQTLLYASRDGGNVGIVSGLLRGPRRCSPLQTVSLKQTRYARTPAASPGARMAHAILFLFFFFKILFIYSSHTHTHTHTEAETQAEGEAGSMQGARCGTRSCVSRITPWAEGGAKPLCHLRCPIIYLIII